MRRLPSILASSAAAIGVLTSAMVLAQVQPGDPCGARERALREATLNARKQRRLNLSNQLRPFYRFELMHLRSACGLTIEQMREIRPEADAAYEEVIARIVDSVAASPKSIGSEDTDYRRDIHEAVAGASRRHLTLAQRAVYEEDLRLREAGRKEAGVDLLVAVLDRELLLTERQRRQIAGSVSAHWDDRWCDVLEAALTQQGWFPKIPDPLVMPYLSPAQQETWRRVPRLQKRLWGVAIDHGGDPDMERALGADPTPRNPAARPKLKARLAVPGPDR